MEMINAENVFQAKRQMDLILSGQVFLMFAPGKSAEYMAEATEKLKAKAIARYKNALALA
jgi:hypothetical protein